MVANGRPRAPVLMRPKPVPDPVSTIRNLGPASDKSFAKIGITTADQLREIGADAAYQKLLKNGTRPHFIGYYALVMGLQGRPWNDCKGDEKVALRKRFDALKGHKKDRPDIEAALDKLGIRVSDYPTNSRPEKK